MVSARIASNRQKIASYLGAGVAIPAAGLVSIAKGSVIIADGDSTVRGFPNYVYNWPAQLAALLTAGGIKASGQNLFGCGSSSFADLLARDSRVAATGAWSNTATLGPGGNADGGSAAGSKTFTPMGQVTRFDVYWRDAAAGRGFTYSVDGGPATQVNSSGVTQPSKVSIAAGPLGIHSLTLAWAVGAVSILGIDAYDDTGGVPLRIWNTGISGSTSAQMIDNTDTQAGRRFFSSWANADLAIIESGINDWRTNVPVETYEANLTTRVQLQKAAKGGTGKVLLMTPVFDNLMTNNGPIQGQYVAAKKRVATAQGVAYLDVRPFFRSWDYANKQGWMIDDVHLTNSGNAVLASLAAKAVRIEA